MPKYDLIEERSPQTILPRDLQDWGDHSREAFEKACRFLQPAIALTPALFRYLPDALGDGDREDILLFFQSKTIEYLDNHINKGTDEGGFAWKYQEGVPQTPPGRHWAWLGGDLTETRMRRHYLGAQCFDAEGLSKHARGILWKLVKRRGPDRAAELFSVKDETQALSALRAALREMARSRRPDFEKALLAGLNELGVSRKPRSRHQSAALNALRDLRDLIADLDQYPDDAFLLEERKQLARKASDAFCLLAPSKGIVIAEALDDERTIVEQADGEDPDEENPAMEHCEGEPMHPVLTAMTTEELQALAREAEHKLLIARQTCYGANPASRKSTPGLFLDETLRFLRYVIDLCRGPHQGSPWPVSYDQWADAKPAVEAMCVGFWRAVARQELVEKGRLSPLDPPLDFPSLYSQWYVSSKALEQPGSRALAKAKSRLEQQGVLDAFYLVICHQPESRADGGREEICRRVRERLADLYAGALAFSEAEALRDHIVDCQDCFFAFNDYIAEQVLWGDVPNPAMAQLRERLHGFKGRLGTLCGDLSEIAIEALFARHRLQYVGTPVSQSEEVFEGFGLASGDEVEIQPLRSGKLFGSPAKATVFEAHCDPERRDAEIVLQLPELPAGTTLLVANGEIGGRRFSIPSAEITEATARFSIGACPEELGGRIRVAYWFAIVEELNDV